MWISGKWLEAGCQTTFGGGTYRWLVLLITTSPIKATGWSINSSTGSLNLGWATIVKKAVCFACNDRSWVCCRCDADSDSSTGCRWFMSAQSASVFFFVSFLVASERANVAWRKLTAKMALTQTEPVVISSVNSMLTSSACQLLSLCVRSCRQLFTSVMSSLNYILRRISISKSGWMHWYFVLMCCCMF